MGDLRAQTGELRGIFKKFNDLLKLGFFLVGSRNIAEEHLALIAVLYSRFAEIVDLRSLAACCLVHHEPPDDNDHYSDDQIRQKAYPPRDNAGGYSVVRLDIFGIGLDVLKKRVYIGKLIRNFLRFVRVVFGLHGHFHNAVVVVDGVLADSLILEICYNVAVFQVFFCAGAAPEKGYDHDHHGYQRDIPDSYSKSVFLHLQIHAFPFYAFIRSKSPA